MSKEKCEWCASIISTTSSPNTHEGRFISEQQLEALSAEEIRINECLEVIRCSECGKLTVKDDHYYNEVCKPEYVPTLPVVKT